MEFFEKTISEEEIFNGKIVRLKKDTVLLETGKQSERELVEHPGGVAVIPYDRDGNVYLVRQFRKPFEKTIYEVPAGKLEYGEDHFECGKRELSEETGFTAEKFTYLGGFYSSPGFCNEIIHIYIAENLTSGETHFDPDERLEIIKVSLDEAMRMISGGIIKDAKSVIGLQSLFIKKRG